MERQCIGIERQYWLWHGLEHLYMKKNGNIYIWQCVHTYLSWEYDKGCLLWFGGLILDKYSASVCRVPAELTKFILPHCSHETFPHRHTHTHTVEALQPRFSRLSPLSWLFFILCNCGRKFDLLQSVIDTEIFLPEVPEMRKKHNLINSV